MARFDFIDHPFNLFVSNLELYLIRYHEENESLMLGYPSNKKGVKELDRVYSILSRYPVPNNVGDPFQPDQGNYREHSLHTEGVLLRKLLQKWGGNEENSTGYCTTGGTEGNYAGLGLGIRRFIGKNPVVLYSDQAHYSVPKFLSFSQADNEMLRTTENGEIDCVHFEECVRKYKGRPFVVLATMGTTVKGAIDDIKRIIEILTENDYTGEEYHLHVDGAFFGGYWSLDESMPEYLIGKDFHTISISLMKWFGGGVGGCFLQSKKIQELRFQLVEYLAGMTDNAISGSRSGFVPVIWLARLAQFDWKQEYQYCMQLRDYLIETLTSKGIAAWCNPYSLIVVFPMEPDKKIYRQFQLAAEFDQHTQQYVSHVVVLPHVTKENLDCLVNMLLSHTHG